MEKIVGLIYSLIELDKQIAKACMERSSDEQTTSLLKRDYIIQEIKILTEMTYDKNGYVIDSIGF